MQKPSFRGIVDGLLSSLIYLNIAGMAVGALWLGLAHQWQVISVGVIALLFSPYLVPIAVIPAGIFSHFMSQARARGDATKERLLFIGTVGYLIAFTALWCAGIFDYVINNVEAQAVHVGLLWSLTSAMLPLVWWAARDRGNLFIVLMIETAQLAIFVPAALHLHSGETAFWPCFFTLAGILAVEAVLQNLYEKKFIEKK